MFEEILRDSRLFDLGQPLFRGMPQSPNHPPFQMVLERRHGDRYRPGGDSGANEIVITGCHVGTHIDALSHYSHLGKLHGGIDAFEAQAGGRFKHHGAETLSPIVGRGVLIDVVRALGEHAGAPGFEITATDIEETLHVQGVDLREGDTVLVRTGWGRLWDEPQRYLDWDAGLPGPGTDAIRWLVEKRPRAVGSDTIAFEHIAPGMGLSELPGHRILLVESGIPIIETLALETLAEAQAHEFLFLLSPLKLVGATASPVRPLALVLEA